MTRHNLCHEYDLATSAKDRINTIFFGLVDPPRMDWQRGSKEIQAAPGCLVVEMEPPYLQYGSVVTSQVAAGRMRSDCGTVISVGGARHIQGCRYENPSDELQPGDRVGVLPYDGKHFRPFGWGGYRSYSKVVDDVHEESRVRMLGVASLNEFERNYKDWWEMVVLKVQKEEVKEKTIVEVNRPGDGRHGRSFVVRDVEERRVWIEDGYLDANDLLIRPVQPLNRWVLIRRLPLQNSQLGVILPDSQHYREGVAQVVAAGPKCEFARSGNWVVYQGKALIVDFEFGDRFGFEGNPKDYVLIHEEDLHAVLSQPVNR